MSQVVPVCVYHIKYQAEYHTTHHIYFEVYNKNMLWRPGYCPMYTASGRW